MALDILVVQKIWEKAIHVLLHFNNTLSSIFTHLSINPCTEGCLRPKPQTVKHVAGGHDALPQTLLLKKNISELRSAQAYRQLITHTECPFVSTVSNQITVQATVIPCFFPNCHMSNLSILKQRLLPVTASKQARIERRCLRRKTQSSLKYSQNILEDFLALAGHLGQSPSSIKLKVRRGARR